LNTDFNRFDNVDLVMGARIFHIESAEGDPNAITSHGQSSISGWMRNECAAIYFLEKQQELIRRRRNRAERIRLDARKKRRELETATLEKEQEQRDLAQRDEANRKKQEADAPRIARLQKEIYDRFAQKYGIF